jgi:LmbE family N-acetylglucosaminyl deacetylase
MKVLVIVAHPDDEIFGCGGTMSRLSSESHEVYISILGEGATSRYRDRAESDPGEVTALRSSAERAARIIGAREVFTHDLPDNRFDTVPLISIAKHVEELVSTVRPQQIFTHHGGDLNVDHGCVNRAVLIATRPQQGLIIPEIYAMEIPSSTEWSFQQVEPAFRPNVFFDITPTLEKKIEALGEYQQELRPFPHPRSPESVRNIARRWGSVSGCEAAEAFELIRAVR